MRTMKGMPMRFISLGRGRGLRFNMTAMIDVVFLLITFFLLICRSMGRENFPVKVPENIMTAVVEEQVESEAITVSVFFKASAEAVGRGQGQTGGQGETKTQGRNVGQAGGEAAGRGVATYAVRDRVYELGGAQYHNDEYLLVEAMAEQIAQQAQRRERPLVYLRADKEAQYGEVQRALLALAQARIRTVHLGVLSGGMEGAGAGRRDK